MAAAKRPPSKRRPARREPGLSEQIATLAAALDRHADALLMLGQAHRAELLAFRAADIRAGATQ